MNWTCPRCHEDLGELNAYCEYCKEADDTIIYNPNPYYVREVRFRHLSERDSMSEIARPMTPGEALYAELYLKHINILKPLVKDRNVQEAREYRERMSKIALEGKAAMWAAEETIKEIQKDSKEPISDFGPTFASDAINTIRERQERIKANRQSSEPQRKLTKAEKLQASLEKLGISSSDAAKMLANAKPTTVSKDGSVEVADTSVEVSDNKVSERSELINPFEKL